MGRPMRKLINLPIWLINLDRATIRRDNMERRLEELGLTYQRFSAVDGVAQQKELAASVDLRAFERSVGRKVLLGEIGAAHSHVEVWKQIARSGSPFALVLEDDVVFHDDFVAAVSAATENAHCWDLLKLNKIRANIPVHQCEIDRWKLNAYIGPCTGLGAYLIKSDLAARLSESIFPISRPIDRELDRLHVHKFRHLGLEPFPSHVNDESSSTITGKNFELVVKFKRHRRIPDYLERAATSFLKLLWLFRSGQIKILKRP